MEDCFIYRAKWLAQSKHGPKIGFLLTRSEHYLWRPGKWFCYTANDDFPNCCEITSTLSFNALVRACKYYHRTAATSLNHIIERRTRLQPKLSRNYDRPFPRVFFFCSKEELRYCYHLACAFFYFRDHNSLEIYYRPLSAPPVCLQTHFCRPKRCDSMCSIDKFIGWHHASLWTRDVLYFGIRLLCLFSELELKRGICNTIYTPAIQMERTTFYPYVDTKISWCKIK